ncbi:MAG: hypothetical protein JSW46_18915 [Gemmatimonadota bacterium]|nr:MAG: hypothetical protein JSW46_18915 [Gemmatimonadota bacterium]
MRHTAWVIGTIGVALAVSSCEDITTQEIQSSLEVSILIEESTFITMGDTLVGDSVRFEARITEGGRSVDIRAAEFTSQDPSVVEILDANAGTAVFSSVGEAVVEVTITDPPLSGQAGDLQARMNVRVTEYVVDLALESTVTGASVDPADGLAGDTVRVVATVTKDGEDVPSSGVAIESSSDPNVVDTAPPGADVAELKDAGTSVLTIAVNDPPIPGNDPLRSTLDVTVKSFAVSLFVETLVPGSNHLEGGDTLVTDSVVFRATVIKSGDVVLKDNTSTGTRWTSWSGGTIIVMKDDSVGAFRATGQDTVFVEFTDLDLPGEPFKLPIEVTTYNTTIDVATLVLGSDHLATGDTLLSDSVEFIPTVTRASDGEERPSSIAYLVSTDSTVVSPRDSTIVKDEALFADTGTVTITARLAQPLLPRDSLLDVLDLEVSTYVVTADPTTPTTPVMGDTVQYDATVIDTRDGSEIVGPGLTFASSNPTAVRILNATTGRALARDTGSAEVEVTLTDPDLPRGTVADTFAVTDITEERFYGTFDVTTGDFGDPVILAASEVHTFTDSTKIVFPNGTVLFVDQINAAGDTIWAIVGAGTNTGQLTLSNLWANGAEDRDNVPTRITFTGQGTIADVFEPNDTFPLAHADSFTVPGVSGVFFQEHMSIDPAKPDPIDNDFFWFTLSENVTLDITAEWQQGANVDFYVCSGVNVPPDDLLGTPCQLEAFDTSTTGPETGSVMLITGGPYVIRFWCQDNCPAVPLTYKVTISRQ